VKHFAALNCLAEEVMDYRRAFTGRKCASMIDALEVLYVIFALIYLTSPFIRFFQPQAQLQKGLPGTMRELALQTSVYLVAGIFMLRRWRSVMRGLSDGKWVIALVALAFVSCLWAEDPLREIRKGIVVGSTSMFGIYFGARYQRDQQVALLCCAIAIIAVMSLSMVILLPQYGIDTWVSVAGSWRGVFETKNVLAKVMVLGIAVFFCCPEGMPGGKGWRIVGVAGCGALMILARSATALAISGALLCLMLSFRLMRSRVTVVIPLLTASLLAFAVISTAAIEQRDALLAMVGRNATLTGRLPLWSLVLDAIAKRPWLGYGFNSFWNGIAGPSAQIVIAAGWFTPHSHNGFLDLCLDLGVCGLLIFGIGYVLRLKTAISDYRASGDRGAMWPLAFLAFIVLYNLTESTLLHTNSLDWALYCACQVREGRQAKRRNAEAAKVEASEVEVVPCPA
jgi:exopolysaccharide production protein ExoQ